MAQLVRETVDGSVPAVSGWYPGYVGLQGRAVSGKSSYKDGGLGGMTF